jgi:peptidoglycan hydrolase-like protein with peptidoglycan-binding domain
MKLVKTLLTVVLVVGLLGGAAYGAGQLVTQRHSDTVASSSDLPGAPDTTHPTPSSPTSSPASKPTHRPPRVADVLKPGARGPQVRELQQRLFQIAWLPETTTGVYDAATVAAVKGFQGKHGLHRTGVLDTRTWDRIKAMTAMPTHDAMFNVLHPG